MPLSQPGARIRDRGMSRHPDGLSTCRRRWYSQNNQLNEEKSQKRNPLDSCFSLTSSILLSQRRLAAAVALPLRCALLPRTKETLRQIVLDNKNESPLVSRFPFSVSTRVCTYLTAPFCTTLSYSVIVNYCSMQIMAEAPEIPVVEHTRARRCKSDLKNVITVKWNITDHSNDAAAVAFSSRPFFRASRENRRPLNQRPFSSHAIALLASRFYYNKRYDVAFTHSVRIHKLHEQFEMQIRKAISR